MPIEEPMGGAYCGFELLLVSPAPVSKYNKSQKPAV